MRKQTKRKIIDLLYEISPKEERDALVLKQSGNTAKDIEMISKALREIEERMNLSENRLIHAVNASIAGLRGDIDVKMVEYTDSALQVHYTKIMGMYGQYEESTSEKTTTLSKTLRGELQKEMKRLGEEIDRINGMVPKAWGGSSRMIYNNGEPMSPQNLYSDINLIMGAGLSLSAVNNTDTLQVDVTISVTGGGGNTFVYNEVVAGSGTSWTLANVPVSGMQAIYANGQRLTPTVDYTISGAIITTLTSWSSGTVLADYQY